MSRGFVSFLFFLLLSPLLILPLHSSSLELETSSPRLLSLRRMEWENTLDTIIREELFVSTRAGFPAHEVRSRINARIVAFVANFPSSHGDAIVYSSGFSTLFHSHYLSLLSEDIAPISLSALDARSLVLIIPVSQTEKYAEYVYTGGFSGASILHTRMVARDFNSLVALPSGYRICITTFQLSWPCAGSG